MAVELRLEAGLIEIVFVSVVTADDIVRVMDYTLAHERTVTVAPDRIAIFRPDTTLAIDFEVVANLVRRRLAFPPPSPVRTAIVVHSPVQRGYARMFQTLNDSPNVTVAAFDDEPGARAWLAEPRTR
jgi:hypothetical protein